MRSAAGPHLPGCETRRGNWQACARGPSVRETRWAAADNTLLCPSICELRASTSLSPDVWLKFLPCQRKCRANFMGLRALHPTSPQGPPKGPARCGRALRSACQGLAGSVPAAAPFHGELSDGPGVRCLGVTVAPLALHQPPAPRKLLCNRDGGSGGSLRKTGPPALACPPPRSRPGIPREEIPGPLPYLGIRRNS